MKIWLLTQIDFVGKYITEWKWRKKMYEFLCDCWNKRYFSMYKINSWLCKSCGCMWWKHTKTHWMSFSKEYRIRHHLEQRCNNPNTKEYKNYWWRWIRCERKNFEEFYRDIWSTYKDGLEIDRIDNNWNYCKENCKRSTRKEQQNNRRVNNVIVYNWKTLTATQWWEFLWVRPNLILKRISRWWDPIRAITENIDNYSELNRVEEDRLNMVSIQCQSQIN